MCGICALFSQDVSSDYLASVRELVVSSSHLIKHRGPDWTGVHQSSGTKLACSMGHERLAIIDPEGGSQPLTNADNTLVLGVNGEIYNHLELRKEYLDYPFKTGSDCEVILPLYQDYLKNTGKLSLIELVNKLNGVFAFVLYDKTNNNFLVARDPIGVNSLYYGVTSQGEIAFASEMKALRFCRVIKMFPPGHFATFRDEKIDIQPYYFPLWRTVNSIDFPEEKLLISVRTALEKAVEARLMSDVPFGTLLSGGLDSSLIASIVSRKVKEMGTEFGNTVHSFSIGLKGSPDLEKAKEVSQFIGSHHHSFVYTVEEGIDAIPMAIYHMETYDVTTIRAGTPMFLLARKIKSYGIKMVFSGEGADEVLGGYLYFHQAPTPEEFQKECHQRTSRLCVADCLRANKTTMAWGLEVRVPFLDKNVLETLMPIHPDYKIRPMEKGGAPIEKYILRKAFDDGTYLPDSILKRQKEQFSDGVGYGWIDGLIDYAESQVSDNDMAMASILYPHNTPTTKEAFLYRRIFAEKFKVPGADQTIDKWIPRTDWQGVGEDPSGRSQGVHEAHSEW